MKIILDGGSTNEENEKHLTCSKPTVLEVRYDSDREQGDTILWKLTAEERRTEAEDENVTVRTWMTAAEFSNVLSKLTLFEKLARIQEEVEDKA